jgi:hypothetical protein
MVQHNREAMIQPVEELAVWTQKKEVMKDFVQGKEHQLWSKMSDHRLCPLVPYWSAFQRGHSTVTNKPQGRISQQFLMMEMFYKKLEIH